MFFFLPKSIYVSVLQIFFLFLYNVVSFSLLLSPTIRAKLSEIDKGWNEKRCEHEHHNHRQKKKKTIAPFLTFSFFKEKGEERKEKESQFRKFKFFFVWLEKNGTIQIRVTSNFSISATHK